jgi:hypothetical protein
MSPIIEVVAGRVRVHCGPVTGEGADMESALKAFWRRAKVLKALAAMSAVRPLAGSI